MQGKMYIYKKRAFLKKQKEKIFSYPAFSEHLEPLHGHLVDGQLGVTRCRGGLGGLVGGGDEEFSNLFIANLYVSVKEGKKYFYQLVAVKIYKESCSVGIAGKVGTPDRYGLKDTRIHG